jgi:hypothetical protein
MGSKSKSQQRFFGMVHSCQKDGNCASDEVKKVASSIKPSDAEDFARTKHDGLPEHKKKKKKRKKLKSYQEFSEQQKLTENLTSQQKQLAGMTMGGNAQQVHRSATNSGINTAKFFRIMSKWLGDIENKMQLRNPGGENNWHQDAVSVLQAALNQAAGGKQQWLASQQVKNYQKVNNQQQSQGPTPLQNIG